MIDSIQKPCVFPTCVIRGNEVSCAGLRKHLYQCSCDDLAIFCKHILKVHSVLLRETISVSDQKEQDSILPENMFSLDDNVLHEKQAASRRGKVQEKLRTIKCIGD